MGECEGWESVRDGRGWRKVVWTLLPTSVTLFPGVWKAEGGCAESTK